MKRLFKDILKGALIMGTVGVALALAAPLLALAIPGALPAGVATYAGAAAVLGNTALPAWMGAFFGSFGAVAAMVTPVCNRIFPENKSGAQKASTQTETPQVACVNIALQHTGVEQELTSAKFRQTLEAERAAALGQSKQV